MKIELQIVGRTEAKATTIRNDSHVAALLRGDCEAVTIERKDGYRYRYTRAAK